MPARAMGTAAISFGLVTVPVRIYPAVQSSAGISFHMLHKKDGVRLKQQFICPRDEEVVPRSETVRGFEIAKDKYVTFTDEELKAVDEKATNGIEISEFVPEDSVDPVYFERTYYLGADKGGDKAYSLLADAMKDAGKAALAQYAARSPPGRRRAAERAMPDRRSARSRALRAAADPRRAARVAELAYVTDAAPGIRRVRSGRGFRYLWPDGRPLGEPGERERIHRLAIPPAWRDVWICPDRRGHIQAIGRDARGRRQYRYHPRWRQLRDEAKYSRMVDFGRALPRIRARVE